MESAYPHHHDPPRFYAWMLERLRDIPDLEWDDSSPLYHSSRDEWHVRGYRKQPAQSPSTTNGSVSPTTPSRSSPTIGSRPSTPRQRSSDSYPLYSTSVIARISTRNLRLERQYHLARAVAKSSDPKGKHHVRVRQLFRLSPRNDGEPLLTVIILEDPGYNTLWDMVNFGANWFTLSRDHECIPEYDPELVASGTSEVGKTHLPTFLDIAIGATACIEMLHNGRHVIHAEIKGDSFHYNRGTGAVKLTNLGAGSKSVEDYLQSGAWSTISRERGVAYKLNFIAPEQTGRVQASPDVRTDIYRLGVFFWNILVGDLPFHGKTPLEIMQNAFSGQVPAITTQRMDVPDALSAVIQKMTAKNVEDRYNAVTGLKWDLVRIQQLLSDGDSDGLRSFTVGSRDVNSRFTLPNLQIGREKEKEKILHVIERVSAAKTNSRYRTTKSLAPGTSDDASSGRQADTSAIDGDTASDVGSMPSRTASNQNVSSANRPEETRNSSSSMDEISPSQSPSMNGFRPTPVSFRMSNDLSANSIASDLATRTMSGSGIPEGNEIILRNASKFKRKGTTEVIMLSGQPGVGKSSLISSVMGEARKKGYTASARFDQVKATPFEPCLKLLSSVMQQIFSEPNVETEFHESLRQYVRQVWPLLSQMLGLPHWLLDKTQVGPYSDRRHSTVPDVTVPKKQTASQKTTDFFRYGTCAKSSRFVAIYLDVLRFLAERKFIIFCLDDLQYADEESLSLLEGLVAAKVQAIVLFTIRDKDKVSPRIRALMQTRSAMLTRLDLEPLSEDQTADYVTATLGRSREYCFSLVAVIQERTHGNPFFVKEMLETCYRTGCLWYSFEESSWMYSLDGVFKEFETQAYGSQISNDHIKKRILDLSPAAITLLKWASLLGTTFAFDTVKLLLGQEAHGERYGRVSPSQQHHAGKVDLVRRSSQEAVRALDEAIAAYVLEADAADGKFRWCHERFLHSAQAMCEDKKNMHFRIAEVMVHNLDHQHYSDYIMAVHICESVNLIQKKISQRQVYRRVLFNAAEKATESGGRDAGLEYLSNCLLLLQPNHWKEDTADVDYQETLHTYTRAAECYYFKGHIEPAMGLLTTIFKNAHDAVDQVPAFILKSRIHSVRGDHPAAFRVLKECLAQLGLEVPDSTWEECDKKYHKLSKEFKQADQATLFNRPLSDCRIHTMRGAVLCDAIAAAFWSDSLLYYQLALVEVEMNLRQAPVTQAGLAYIHLAACAVGRFDDVSLGCDMADYAQELLRKYQADEYTYGRGQTLYCILIGHLQQPMDALHLALSTGLDLSLSAGDSMMALLNVGYQASVKIWGSEDLVDVENYCTYGAEEIHRWQSDIRGGSHVISAKQFAKALQGKTRMDSAENVLSDSEHDARSYLEYMRTKAVRFERSLALYRFYQMLAQYLFGYYEEAIEIGDRLSAFLDDFWSSRMVVMIPFYTCLARCARYWEDPNPSEGTRHSIIEEARRIKERLEAWSTVNDANYAALMHMISAQIAEFECRYDLCVQGYENALDAAELNGSHLDFGLVSEASGEFLIRRGAKRLARTSFLDAIAAYRRVSAFAKATQIQEKFEYLVRGCAPLHSAESGCQTVETEFPLAAVPMEQEPEIPDMPFNGPGHVSKGSGQSQAFQADAASLGLDVLDMQSILNSSQVLASELDFDRLDEAMTKIIMDSTGAIGCGLVKEGEDEEWVVSSLTLTYWDEPKKNIKMDEENIGALQLVLTAMRFRETIFIPNIHEQTRFSISNHDLQRFRESKAIIVQPIMRGETDVLGAIFIHGRSFTQRNVTFLQLLVNAFSTSITNSRLFKEVEKVSANNAVMVESQKHALNQARQAEQKAKNAEAEAMRNVKLKEEAAKAKSMFLANVSHELRTPLNGVIGMSELLKGSTLTTEQESYADSIRVCADTLLTVINDILDYSKLEAGKMQMFSVPLSLHETIHEVVRVLSYSNTEKGLQTIVNLDLHPEALVMGDPVRLHQILMNLMSNSYKFTQQGSVTLAATVDQEDDKEATITISVADTGMGIPEEQRKKLFLPFSQADSSTARSFGGTGLGLSICKAIIEGVMKGKIWLESDLNEGTKVSFTVTFPKAPDTKGSIRAGDSSRSVYHQPLPRRPTADPMAIYSPNEEDNKRDLRRHNSGNAPGTVDLSQIPHDRMKVLVAEDNPVNQKIAIAFVKKLGFQCSAFPDGRQAVDALNKAAVEGDPFHIVLMDVQMPVLDGYDATREIRKSENERVRKVLVIAMTASAIRGDRERCLDSGMNSYLAKPVRQNVLKGMIDHWINAPHSAAKEAVEEVHPASVNGDANPKGKENEPTKAKA